MQAKSSSSRSNNKCNQNKDAALLTLKPAQGQSTKSGHAHESRHGGGGDGDDDGDGDVDDVALRCDAPGNQPATAYYRRLAFPDPETLPLPLVLPNISQTQKQRKLHSVQHGEQMLANNFRNIITQIKV